MENSYQNTTTDCTQGKKKKWNPLSELLELATCMFANALYSWKGGGGGGVTEH